MGSMNSSGMISFCSGLPRAELDGRGQPDRKGLDGFPGEVSGGWLEDGPAPERAPGGQMKDGMRKQFNNIQERVR